ncbi:hypothetical protein [Glycomyces algeriensis]|jgi:hypothetical protein|uniref:DUF308 domain-containing protein n=1 Tax=Glycomyces algeriensis TaxID=256037 RepID=A0A9W6LGB7_9ACTN|nr:hypothetical protein [Glycomyces algeriensis]MDA1365198.1 hypothetical protein [Glycomyces algeriensis]MDR7349738.1 hypothetical protein [Glycomyces algeriensis]GLI42448.1 hypothetical protein GALLR39Z86_22980 [Glycomyces algeriensis]
MTDRSEQEGNGEPDSGEQGGAPEELRPEDVDRRFNELIKGLGDTGSGILKEHDAEGRQAEAEPTPPRASSSSDDEPTLLDLWDVELPDDDDEDDYDPPEPPPVPWPSLPAVGGLLLIIGGIALLVNPGMAPLGTNPGRLVGFVGFLIGVWLLISRLRPDKEPDDTDDGAVV